MKKMMMALAALCVAGAASAVDIDWKTGYTWNVNYTSTGVQGPSTDPAAPNTLDLGKTFNLSTDYLSVTTVFTVNALPGSDGGWRSILSLYNSTSGGKDDNFRLSVTNWKDLNNDREKDPYNTFVLNGNLVGSGAGADAYGPVEDPDYTPVANQKYSATIVFDGGNATVTISTVGEDGTLTTVASMVKENIGSNPSGSTYDATIDSIILGTASVNEENANRTFANGALTVESVTVVPEPTALALLALGVAGLALRRKAA